MYSFIAQASEPEFLNRLIRFFGVGLWRLIAVEKDGGDDEGGSEDELEAEDEAEEKNWNENGNS